MRGWAEEGLGLDHAGPRRPRQRFWLVLKALGSQCWVLSRAVTIGYAFGEDHCGISVDNGDKGRCGKIGEEATIIVQARDDGGLGCRMGSVVAVQPLSEVDAGTVDQMC